MRASGIVGVGALTDAPEVCALVEAARGARAVIGRLETISEATLARLRGVGLTHAVVTLGAGTEAGHRFVRPAAPPLDALLASARAARALGLIVLVEAPLTRPSAPTLPDVARLATSIPATALVVRLPVLAPAPYPSLPLALGYARLALDHARRAGVLPVLVDAPRCMLGPYAPVTIALHARRATRACEVCAARPSCAGLDEAAGAVALPGLSTDLEIPERAHNVGHLLTALGELPT